MEKSRAIELLKLAVPIKALTQQEYADFVEAVNMGMDALEQPTSPDTIDRKAALDALRRCQTYLYDARDPELKIKLSSANAAIKELPTIQPEKAQLSQEGTTSDMISRTETVEHLRGVLDVTVPITDYDGGYVDGIEVGISTVSTMPTIQPQSTTGQLNDGARSTAQSTDLIDRQAAIDALDCINGVEEVLRSLPSVQPKQQHGRVFKGIVVKYYPSYNTYPEYKGKPYFSIKYTEKGQSFIGYGTYNPEVLSEYLKEYFMPPAQPEPKEGHWIPHETPDGGEQYECSLCGVLWEFNDGTPEDNEAYFCPKCGKKLITK